MLGDSRALKEMKFRLNTTWYHGTFKDSYEDIKANGINVDLGIALKRKLDFGPGFYLTSHQKQAERFIRGKHQSLLFNKDRTPCVIVYEIDMEKLLSNFKGYYFFDFDKDFADFVAENRRDPGLRHDYDFVFGKVADGRELVLATDLYRQNKLSDVTYLKKIINRKFADDDQLSIHNNQISDIMKEINMYELWKGLSELAIKERTDNRKIFSDSAVEYMHENYAVNKVRAQELMSAYIDKINVNDPITQHLGPDYFAIQILMAEEIIPYQAM